MSAELMHLYPFLQEVVDLGALTQSEAWELQDAMMSAGDGWLVLEQSREHLGLALWLVEAEPHNKLPV